MKTKKIITPRFTIQKPAFFRLKIIFGKSPFIKEKITDIVIREIGKENPRKKVSSFSFGNEIILKYSLLRITRAEITSPMERQRRDAWWNFSETGASGLKKLTGNKDNDYCRQIEFCKGKDSIANG
jgi:hypothetical protein